MMLEGPGFEVVDLGTAEGARRVILSKSVHERVKQVAANPHAEKEYNRRPG